MNNNRWTRRSLLATGAGAMTTAAPGQDRAPDAPIVLGQVSLSFYAVTGAVVQAVLERLGHSVAVRQGPHEEIFPLLGEGSIDLMAAAWLPEGHAAYWKKFGENAEEAATLYDGARFFWGVPDYVPAADVASIVDLAKPAVASRMTRMIQGIGTGATITSVSRKAIEDYRLHNQGYSLRPGTPAEWTGAYNSAVREERWIVFPTWAPQYLNRGGKIRPLEDPLGVLGSVNRAALVGPRERLRRLPQATRAVLQRVRLGMESVTEMDWLVNVGGKSPKEAAQQWMAENESKVAAWLRH